MQDKKKEIIVRGGVILIIILALTFYFLGDLQITCPFHKLTGLYCPGCGITRTIISIFQLEFYQAFRYNSYVFLLFPFLIPYVIYLVYIWLFTKEDKISKNIPKKVTYFLIISLIIYGIMRNISCFSWLAPTFIN